MIFIFIKLKDIKEMIRFVIIGFIATGIQYGVYLVLKSVNINYIVAYVLGYIISFMFNYIASNYFTFNTKPTVKSSMGFIISHVINLCLQVILLRVFIFLGVGLNIAPIFVFAICVPTNFIMVRYALKKFGKNK